MKRIIFAALLLGAAFLTSCNENKPVADNGMEARMDSLQRIVNQKDNEINDIMATMNEIQEGLRLITDAENKVSIIKDGENSNKSAMIKENIQFIANQMQRNRELVAKLRQQLRGSSLKAEELKSTIENMAKQLDEKDLELKELRAELNAKDIHIAELDEEVSNLTTNVTTLKQENSQQTQTINAQDKQLNTAWYVFGTKKELKDQHIIEGDKVLQSNFNKSYFTKVDIRVDKEIKLYSKSAKMLTSHPASSYTLQQDANKQYILRITDPDNFWSTSKYLVVLVK